MNIKYFDFNCGIGAVAHALKERKVWRCVGECNDDDSNGRHMYYNNTDRLVVKNFADNVKTESVPDFDVFMVTRHPILQRQLRTRGGLLASGGHQTTRGCDCVRCQQLVGQHQTNHQDNDEQQRIFVLREYLIVVGV